MRSRFFVLSAMVLALPAGLVLTGSVAAAQQSDSARRASNSVEEEVTVVAPRVMRTHVRERTAYGVAHYDLMTLTHRVGYADLDLSRPEDVKMLKRRIRATANQLCSQLANAPPVQPRSMQCVQQATQGAMAQARAAIAAAKK